MNNYFPPRRASDLAWSAWWLLLAPKGNETERHSPAMEALGDRVGRRWCRGRCRRAAAPGLVPEADVVAGEDDQRAQQDLQLERLGVEQEADDGDQRSEEHTSELQSLLRTSYAVYCLKKN